MITVDELEWMIHGAGGFQKKEQPFTGERMSWLQEARRIAGCGASQISRSSGNNGI